MYAKAVRAAVRTHSARPVIATEDESDEVVAARMNALGKRLSGHPRRTLTDSDVQRLINGWWEDYRKIEPLHSFLGWSAWEFYKYQRYGVLPT